MRLHWIPHGCHLIGVLFACIRVLHHSQRIRHTRERDMDPIIVEKPSSLIPYPSSRKREEVLA